MMTKVDAGAGQDFELCRSVRFVAPLPGCTPIESVNTFAASPATEGLGVYLQVHVRVRGRPDPVTGYLVDIGRLDAAVRDRVAPLVSAMIATGLGDAIVELLHQSVIQLNDLSPPLYALRWDLSPTLSVEMEADAVTQVLIRQQFEFAASHRLHCPSLSDEENRRLFGKCNNPNGHGHNYRLEVAVRAEVDRGTGRPSLGLDAMERIVRREVLDLLDHRNLNLDVPAFRDTNPSVENIASLCHDLLVEPIRAAGGTLHAVTLWETEKTSCTVTARTAVNA